MTFAKDKDLSGIETEQLEAMLKHGASAYTKDELERVKRELANRKVNLAENEEGEFELAPQAKELLKKGKAFLSFEGRLNRLRFFLYLLILLVVMIISQAAMRFWGGIAVTVVAGIVQITVVVVAISLWIRRLRDMNNSPWWSLIIFIPFLNFFVGWWLLIAYGTEGPNRFGPDPLAKA